MQSIYERKSSINLAVTEIISFRQRDLGLFSIIDKLLQTLILGKGRPEDLRKTA